jgi:hypothetical protein
MAHNLDDAVELEQVASRFATRAEAQAAAEQLTQASWRTICCPQNGPGRDFERRHLAQQ